MLLSPHVSVPLVIFGFGLTLFLALVCLLRMQYRRQRIQQARLNRSLRTYASSEQEKAA